MNEAEVQHARAYLSGDHETVDRLRWTKYWQWTDSPAHRKLCLVNEAVCLMAWEQITPSLTADQENIFEAVRLLNSFAKTVRGTKGEKQIYWLKREAIGWACKEGLGNIQAVVTRVPCRSCDGTGIYQGWAFEPHESDQPCRRCQGLGYVDLHFHAVDIAGRFTFHLKSGHTTPFAGHQIDRLVPHPDPMMKLNRAGRSLDWEQATDLVRFLKRRFYENEPLYVRDIYTYMNREPEWSGWPGGRK